MPYKFNYEKLSEDLTKAITGKNRPVKGKITQADIDRLNDDIMQDIGDEIYDDIDEVDE